MRAARGRRNPVVVARDSTAKSGAAAVPARAHLKNSTPPPEPSPIRVLVAESTSMGCELLADSLRRCNRFEVTTCRHDAPELLRALAGHRADVALISAPVNGQGFTPWSELIRKVHAVSPETRVIVLLDSAERGWVVDAFRSGAVGVFCRTESFQALRKCIASVRMGQIWADSEKLHFLLQALANAPGPHLVDAKGMVLLSEREEDVVRLVAEGLPNREIACQLGLSEHTVKNYLFRIFDKLGISNRTELILYVFTRRECSSFVRTTQVEGSASGKFCASTGVPESQATGPANGV